MSSSVSNEMPKKVGVVGLGYVGLSLAVAMGRALPTLGYDVSERRVAELQQGLDANGETTREELQAPLLTLSSDPHSLEETDFIVVAVPTPIDRANRPDLSILIEASAMVGRALKSIVSKPGSPRYPLPLVSFESTVYPGCTEEVCIPVMERESGLTAGKDFSVGYSPERINPGDREHTLDKVIKIVSGIDKPTLDMMARVYGTVAKAGVHEAPNLRTGEAAKVIENIQRDLNIALMNELTVLFGRLGIETNEVLAAAGSKWNFLPFRPGLVGGHCIPVDPYYLTHKAQEVGYHPEVILAGRRINDSMGIYAAQQVVKRLIQARRPVHAAQVLVLGVAFKEDTRDLRNTKVLDMIQEMASYGVEVFVHDPVVDQEQLQAKGLRVVADPFRAAASGSVNGAKAYDGVVLAVPHTIFREKSIEDYLGLLKTDESACVFADLNGIKGGMRDTHANVIYWTL